ncbi:hypothetical protein FGG08_001418 [Glutinoglossum americanum]|uniref:SNF2 family helicase/ATPase n=1 Tax=Glutinoglossum americanum TaxID=1670608 RepID=A0A9P8L682_9PEZI|nr:hypothetical protein FGG08_001418 [Glutinoglossum americanum]
MEDPLDWSVEQVVATLTDRDNHLLQINQNSVVPDLDELAKGLRDNLINGLTLLTIVNDNVLREDLGLRALGHRAFVLRVIQILRAKSIKFREQEYEMGLLRTPIPSLQGGMSDAARSPTISALSPFSAQAAPLHPQLYEHPTPTLFFGSAASRAPLHRTSSTTSFSLEGGRQLLGQQPIEDSPKLRPQGNMGFAPPEFERLKFGNAQGPPITDDRAGGVIREKALEASHFQPERAVASRDINNRKEVAPTLVSKDIMELEEEPPSIPESIAPKTIVNGKERKRLAPTLVLGSSVASHRDRKSARSRVALQSSPSTSEGVRMPSKSQERAALIRGFPDSYLGIRKIPADHLFFGDAATGRELQDDIEDEDNFVITSGGRISNGCRLYVNKLMRHYLFKPVQVTFSRKGMICHAIQPYSAKILQMLPNQQTQSFTLFSLSGHLFRITRENMSNWPEVSADGTFIEKASADSNSATPNPLTPSPEEDGNHDWDFLLKWQHTGSDIIPAQLGESGSEGEYDLDTWNEIEQERGTLEGTPEKAGRRILREDEVNQAIDDGISGLVAKWESEKLPKRELKAWSIWKKSRREGTKRLQIRESQRRIDHINGARLSKMRDEIVTEIWTKAAAVRNQCKIMEQSVFDLEDLKWTISLLERKREPQRPPPRPRREKVAKQPYFDEEEGVEVLGSGTDGFESGWDKDELGDFVIDDSAPEEENLVDVDTQMADVEDAEMESADEEPTTWKRRRSSAASNPIRGMGGGDVPMNIPPVTTEGVSSILMTAASSPLSPARTLTSPNVTLPNTPTEVGSTHMSQLTAVFPPHRPSTFIDLTLSDPSEMPNPFRSGLKVPGRSQDALKISKGTDGGSIATGAKGNAIDLAASTDDDRPPGTSKEMSLETFEKRGDRERVIICIVGGGMDDKKRRLLGTRLAKQPRKALRQDVASGLESLSMGFGAAFAKGSENNSTVMRLTRLFLCWLQSRRQLWDEKPSAQLLLLAESKKEFFIFRRFLREVLRQYEPDLFEDIPVNYNSDIQARRGDKPPPSKKKKTIESERVNVVNHDYDTDAMGSSPHNKRKRPVFENLGAKHTRENDRQRLREQEQRRAQLEKRLARMGTTSAGDPSRIIVNTGKFENQEFIFLNEHIGKRIKPHQIQGVQFMWRELVMDEKSLQGCLLAHTMGLGKTMQVYVYFNSRFARIVLLTGISITLLVTIAEAARSANPGVYSQIPPSLRQSRSLVLCPPSLIDNWWDEFLMWAPQPMEESIGQLRKVDSSMVNIARRCSEISAWYDEGGVLIMSYDMFRNFVLNNPTKARAPPLNEEQHNILKKELLSGPNIIIADEAHRLRNTTTSTAAAVSQLRSRSRIALTGSPLANSLEEYHSMIDWIAPGYLGPMVEFKAKYVEPIQDGLYFDSSLPEQRRCLKMLRVLKSDLEPKVNRADISVLKGSLPPKTEFLIKVPLTRVQEDAYKRYVRSILSGSNGDVGNTCLWDWLAILSLLCNHPLCFKSKLLERDQSDTLRGNPAPVDAGTSDEDPIEDGRVELEPGDAPVSKIGMTPAIIKQQIAALDQVGKELNSTLHSHRVVIFNEILDASVSAGDKVLVFSHYILTLNYLESLLREGGRRYSRLDGATKMSDRQKATKAFNLNDIDVYLVSIRAGGLGLNLYGANRVIIFDFNFNPTWEEQAIGRAYRIGQRKLTYVYRFISAGTFEEVIHNKAVFKMQLASRVVDKKNPTRYAVKKGRDYLFEPKAVDRKDLSGVKGKDPKVLDKVLAAHEEDNCVTSIELTETFHRDDGDKLTVEEEQEADQLLKDEQLKRADPGAYNKMVLERQRTAVAQAQAREAWMRSQPATLPLTLPIPTTFIPGRTSASTRVAALSARNETSSPYVIESLLDPLEGASKSTPGVLGPPAAEGTTLLNQAGDGLGSTAGGHGHPALSGMNNGEASGLGPQISPFISAVLELEKQRDAGGC